MLSGHPDVLSANELLSMAQPAAIPPGEIDGEGFWRLLSDPREEMSFLLRIGAEPDEILYPVDGGGRFDRDSGVPPIALVCLPSLTDAPDALYGELEAPIRALPTAPVGTQYGILLDLLAELLGKRVWVERSGGSLRLAGEIVERFDRPNVVHLHRNGVDTALSMSRHSPYRVKMLRRLGHESLTERAFREVEIPVEHYGQVWSMRVLRGTRQLAALPAGDVLHLSYERLLDDPVAELGSVAEMLALDDPRGAWLERAAAAARRPKRDDARPAVGAAELERLRRACEPGERRRAKLAETRAAAPAN